MKSDNMKSRNFLSPGVVLLVLWTLVAQAAVIKGQGTAKGQDPVKGQHPFGGQDPVKGQNPFKGQDPVKGQDLFKAQDPFKGQDQVEVPFPHKPGFCPRLQIQCASINPPNKCLRDADCPGRMKCCVGNCGRDCMNPW
ncbi:elafin [Megaptera novaeangliae]